MKVAFFNLVLRGLAISGRFLVLIGIGRYLTEGDLGIYGLFYSTIILSLYFIGLDFYTFSTREIIAAEVTDRLLIVRNQIVFHLLSYIIVLPMLLPVFFYQIIPFEFMIWFFLILIFEHLSQEFFRIFIALSRSVFANFTAFIRSGLWVFILAGLWAFNITSLINLKVILIAWSMGSALSVLISFVYLKIVVPGSITRSKLEWRWIKQGLITALPFFIGSVCYKIIEHANRYFIDFFYDKELVGIFTFYSGIANIITVIVNTAVIIIVYPRLYELYINKEWEKYRSERRKFYRNVLLLSLGSGVILLFLINPLLNLIGKAGAFLPHLETFWYLIIANVIFNVSLIPHFLLYVQRRDVPIMTITLIGMIFNLLANFFLIRDFGINGAALSMILSFAMIAVGKFYINGKRSPDQAV